MSAVFTEFYLRSGGSDLNAGSTNADAPAVTYTSGSWVSSTRVFTGDGFDAGHPEAAKAAAMFVAANLCTAEEARDSQYTVSYPAGDVATADDVAAARAANARADAIDAISTQARGVWAAFENEKVNPARSDPGLPVPTFADFQAMVTAAAGGGQ